VIILMNHRRHARKARLDISLSGRMGRCGARHAKFVFVAYAARRGGQNIQVIASFELM